MVASPADAMAAGPRLLTADALAETRAYAARRGDVAFCATEGGRLRGLGCDRRYPSASMVKALLLVAALRRARDRPLTAGERRLLGPMIRVSSNAAALRVRMIVGRLGLDDVGRAAGMRHLDTATTLFSTGVTAGDLARLFWRLDELVPSRHRRYARRLLETVVARQAFGIPRALRPRGWRVAFKGGWRRGLTHQAALVESRSGGDRVALAVLTAGPPSMAYRVKTIEGVARRLTHHRDFAKATRPLGAGWGQAHWWTARTVPGGFSAARPGWPGYVREQLVRSSALTSVSR